MIARGKILILLVLAVAAMTASACGAGEPPGASDGSNHEINLYHCGVEPTRFERRLWRAKPVPFDETNKPEDFRGTGTMTLVSKDEARFVDESGATIDFVPVEEGWEPPPCG